MACSHGAVLRSVTSGKLGWDPVKVGTLVGSVAQAEGRFGGSGHCKNTNGIALAGGCTHR